MFTLNTIILAGRLGGDAEIVPLAGGRRAGKIDLAVDRNVKGPSGKWKTETHWARVVTYAPFLVDLLAASGKSGTPFYVQGALRARSWDQGGFRAREWTDKSTGEVKTSYKIEVETGTGIVPVLERKKEKANADR